MEFKKTPVYGTDSSGSMVFQKRYLNKNRLAGELFQLTFSCHFDFSEFPFDYHECPIEYGDNVFSQAQMRFNITQAVFGNVSTKTGGDPINLDNLPFPFEFQLLGLATFEIRNIYGVSYSYTGIVLKMRRKSPGQLLSGFFYPTAAFALLSMLSFLIKSDVVRLFVLILKNLIYNFHKLVPLISL